MPLEPLIERYTYQLCERWMPNAFKEYNKELIVVYGEKVENEIKVGVVLDAVGRGKYSLSQCSKFLDMINDGLVSNGDVLYLQDYWTPGLEAIFYALDLYKIDIKIYGMLHAQSVDEYDFTYPMRDWMRYYELGLDRRMTGIFVGNKIHRDQLRESGFRAPIHVVSLPIDKKEVLEWAPDFTIEEKENIVVFSSRFDWEKNPLFMLATAKQFLKEHQDWEWYITSSASKLRSNDRFALDELKSFAEIEPRFKIKTGISKVEYYDILSRAKIQFNSSLQDYVSWTLIEATLYKCDICYPNFRCFPEIIHNSRLYQAFNVESAMEVLNRVVLKPDYELHKRIGDVSDLGRHLESYIIANGIDREVNLWNEYDYYKKIIG